MDTYSLMRQFADSWMLLAMTLFFLGVVLWAFRPGSRSTHADTAAIPFRNEDAPARETVNRTRQSVGADAEPTEPTAGERK